MKLAVVTQRYGADVSGGAELHARFVAEHLARHHDVEVLTTCARDYVTWANELPPGEDRVNGVTVRRFPVKHPRRPEDFGRRSALVFDRVHSLADEIAWLESEGPASPRLIRYVASSRDCFDYFVFFSYRYYHAWHGVRAVAERALLVPTAERDAAIGLAMFAPMFRGVRAMMYNSFEERAMIRAASRQDHRGAAAAGEAAVAGDVPGVVVGVGSDVPDRCEPGRFRRKFGIEGRFAIYVGRIDENKGCKELFDYFRRACQAGRTGLTLVLVGNSILPIPQDHRIRHLGFLADRDKFDGMCAADLLIMPSYYESLSMVALEAWGLGRPVLANGRCDVLKGQCLRSNAGLFYESYAEFAETLRVLETNRGLNDALGRNGREYFKRHYTWPVIERKYLDVLARLHDDDRQQRPRPALEPLPSWFARRRRTLLPAAEVLARIPSGPVLPSRSVSRLQARRRPA